MTHIFIWRKNRKPELYGQKCRILAYGKMRSVLIEFESGQREITDKWAVRRLK